MNNRKRTDALIKPTDSRILVSNQLDADTTVDIVRFGFAAEKVSFQASGDLAGTVEFSINGQDFFGSAAISTTPGSFSTHNVIVARVTRTSGSGRLSIAAK